MANTKEELTKEFINQSWCHFLNNSTTHEFTLLPNDSEESTPTPSITNPVTFIQNSHTILLEDLELLATELRITGIIDEENTFTWNEVVIPVEEDKRQQRLVSVPEEDSDEECTIDDEASYISSTTSTDSSEETSISHHTIEEERAEYFDTPLRTAFFRSFPPANRFSEQTLTHYTQKLTALFMKLVKDNHI
jgi:hypothetical protein